MLAAGTAWKLLDLGGGGGGGERGEGHLFNIKGVLPANKW